MKKLYSTILGIFFTSAACLAQSSALITTISNNQTIADGATVYEGILGNGTSQIDFNIKNTSANTKVYKLKRFDDVLNSGATAYFCFNGTCYTPNTTTSPVSLTLTAGQDVSSINLPMQLHYDEAATAGTSEIRYQLYDAANINDITTFTIKYNNPLSIKATTKQFAVSAVFPSPVSSKAQFSVFSTNDFSNAEVSLVNSLGAEVFKKIVLLSSGNNLVTIDCDNQTSGIYFINVKQGLSNITKKIIINN